MLIAWYAYAHEMRLFFSCKSLATFCHLSKIIQGGLGSLASPKNITIEDQCSSSRGSGLFEMLRLQLEQSMQELQR
jgi:hypothetical protein